MKAYFFLVIWLISNVVLHAQNTNDYALAENYFRNNEFEKAATLFKKLVDKSPRSTVYLERLIACYQETNKFEVAEQLLKRKLDKKPSLAYLNVYLGYNYERQQNQVTADAYYKVALQSINKKTHYGVTIASIFKNYNKLDLAIEAYKRIMAANPNTNYGFQIAQIYGEQGNFEQMFESFIDYVDKDERKLRTVKRLSARYITDDAENNTNILFKKALLRRAVRHPKNVWNNLLAWLFTKQKEYDKALIQQKALFQRDPNNIDGIEQIGKIAFFDKDYTVAKACYEMVLNNTNQIDNKLQALLSILKIGVKTKEPNTQQQFEQVFSQYGINRNTIAIQIVYADYLLFEKNNPKAAVEVLDNALKLSGSNYQKATIQLKMADALVYQSKFNKALIYYTQIQNRFKNHSYAHQARFKVAQTSYFKKDFKWAKAQLKILKGSASQLIANDAADLFLLISDNEPKDSISTGLSEYAQADLLAFQNKTREAIIIFNDIRTRFKGQPIEDEALFKQAKLYIKQQQYNEALSNLTHLISLNQEGVWADDAFYTMAELYYKELDNPVKAQEYYETILFKYPSSIYLVDARKKYRKIRGDQIN